MRRSIATRSSLQMSVLSILGVALIALFGYHCVWMWQDIRHQETLERAANAVEQVLAAAREAIVDARFLDDYASGAEQAGTVRSLLTYDGDAGSGELEARLAQFR